ncbi:hypothetical protein [Brevibacillus brevis]|nr:hypothetical protein [Brevibacillus brevis]
MPNKEQVKEAYDCAIWALEHMVDADVSEEQKEEIQRALDVLAELKKKVQ